MIAFALVVGVLTLGVAVWVLRMLTQARPTGRLTADQLNAEVYRDQIAELDAQWQAGGMAQPHYARARDELHRRLLSDEDAAGAAGAPSESGSWLGVGLALALPACVLGVYVALGSPGALEDKAPHAVTTAELEQTAIMLREALQADPTDAARWVTLAQTDAALGRNADAAAAFERAAPVVSKSAELLLAHAEALAALDGGNLRGRALELVQSALRLEPDRPEALLIAGRAANQRGDRDAALAYWSRLRRQLDPESTGAQALDIAIARVNAQRAAPVAPSAAASRP